MAMVNADISAGHAVDEDGRAVVGRDLPCVRCGYQLRGLPVEGKCPECGGEVRRSLMGDLLMFADAGYVRVLRIGAMLAEAGIVIALVAIFGGMGVLFLSLAADYGSGVFEVVSVAASAGVLLFGLLSLVGWWMLTWSDPARLGRDTGVTARKMVRCGVVLTAVGWIGAAVFGAAAARAMVSPVVFLPSLNVLSLTGVVGVVLQLFGGASYMRHMAERVRAPVIGKAARHVRYLTIATLCVGMVGGVAGVFLAFGFRGPMVGIVMVPPLVIGWVLLALTAGRYASVVDLTRREIGLALGVIGSGAGEESSKFKAQSSEFK
jgi:hypothetical protein